MIDIFRGFVRTKDKKPTQKFGNGEKLLTLEEVSNADEYAGILNGEYTVLDFDKEEDADIAYKIVQDENLNARVIATSRGKHIIMKNSKRVYKCGVKRINALGLEFDVKHGINSYIVLKKDGKLRDIIRDFDESREIDTIPSYFVPIQDAKDFRGLKEGDGRNQQLFTYMINLKRNGFANDAVIETIKLINNYILADPLGETEIKTLCREEAVEKIHITTAVDDFGNPILKPTEYTDVAMAKLFSTNYKNVIRYNLATGWLVWNEKVWEMNELAAERVYKEFLDKVLTTAKSEVTQAYKQVDINGKKDDSAIKLAEQFFKFVMKMNDAGKISAVMKLARSDLEIDIKELDANPFELNTPSGIISLMDGTITSHDPSHMCTKITNYSPSTKGEKEWLKFIDTITQGDKEFKDYLQTLAGSIAIGRVYNEALIIAQGSGSNGKSTMFNTIFEVLGDYSGKIPADSLTTRVKNAKVDLAELLGKRFILASETEEGQRLSISMLKQIASVDRISAERKYHDPFSFIPSHTVVLYTNFLPRVGSNDNGTWRRIVVAPFNTTITNPEKDFAEKLLAKSAEAVMKWITDGVKMFIDNKYCLPNCQLVTKAITSYKEDNDWMESFLNDCCIIDEKERVAGGVLFKTYRQWTTEVGEYPRRNRDFAEALRVAGYESKKTNKGTLWLGLNINPERSFVKCEEFL